MVGATGVFASALPWLEIQYYFIIDIDSDGIETYVYCHSLGPYAGGLQERVAAQNALFRALDQLATGGLRERSAPRYHTVLLQLCVGLLEALGNPDVQLYSVALES